MSTLRLAQGALCLALLATPLAPLVVAFPPAVPPASCFEDGENPGVDVLFVLDLTGSMGGVLSSAKAEATAIMGDLAASVPDIRFGAASHMDYDGYFTYPGYATTYGSAGDYPWRLDQDITTDTAAVQAGIDGMLLGSGADGPESYVTAMYEATQSVSWGADRLRVVVFFADNVPHDLEWNGRNTGGEPGRDGIAMTADDLDWQTVVSDMAGSGIRVVGINSGGAHEMMSYLATVTNGNWTNLGSGSTFRQTVVDMVLGVVDGPVPHDVVPPTVSFTSPTSARFLRDGVDIGPSPGAETMLLDSDLPYSLAAADDCKLQRVEIRDNGDLIRTFTDFPLEGTYLAASLPPGHHVLEAKAYDWVGQTATALLPVRILDIDERGYAEALRVSLNVPAAVDVRGGQAEASGPSGHDAAHFGARDVATALGPVSYRTLTGEADTWLDPDATSSARTVSRVAGLDLFNGLITADAVRAVSDVSQTLGGAVTLDTSGSTIAGLRIAGEPVAFEGSTQDVPVPGLGFVRLFEIEAPDPSRAVQQVNMLHVFVDTPTVKGEVIVASAFAAAGFLDAGDVPHHAMADMDDAGTDADAGHFGSATPIAPGVYSGRVSGADPVDAYSFTAVEGDRIALALLPASRVDALLYRETLPATPNMLAILTPSPALDTWLRLYDPLGVPRDSAALGAGDRIEFNADVDGTWTAVVEHFEEETRNYTLAFSITPIVFLSGDDGEGDAPSACADARLVDKGPHSGVMRGDDFQDAYAFPVAIGEIVTVTLKPDELDDGANFDLYLYDFECNLVGYSTFGLETGGLMPKGAPDVVYALPAERTGLYRAIVTREDGVGNYYLDIESTNPMPTLPDNDAGTGRDSTGPGDAIPLTAPTVVQGRFPDEHDAVDWYVVTGVPGERLRIVVESSALSSVVARIYDASLVPQTSAISATVPAEFDLPGGTYYLELARMSGGGNYMIAATSTAR